MLLKIHEFETHSPILKLIILIPKCKLILLNILRPLVMRRVSLSLAMSTGKQDYFKLHEYVT